MFSFEEENLQIVEIPKENEEETFKKEREKAVIRGSILNNPKRLRELENMLNFF